MRAVRTVVNGVVRPVLEAKIGRSLVHLLYIEGDGIRVKRVEKEYHFNRARPLIGEYTDKQVLKQFKRIAKLRGATLSAKELLKHG